MAAKYFTVVTHKGTELIADAVVSDGRLAIVEMAVGDTGGAPWSPLPTQTTLINERYRTNTNKVFADAKNPNQIIVECIIPENIGGWWIREAGLFDASGHLVAVASCPDTYKPVLEQGSGRNSILRMVLIVSEVAAIELKSDPTTVIATRSYVDEQILILGNGVSDSIRKMDEQITALESATAENLSKHEKSRNHPDATLTEKGFTQLSNKIDSDSEVLAATPAAIKAAIAAAVRQAWELSNPVSISLFFFENVNPNKLWPWSRWEYTGEDRTVRIAKQDGSNVGQTGGSDTVAIARANLPPDKIGVSGKANQTDLGSKKTKRSGGHSHGGVPKRNSNYELGGNNRVFFDPYQEGNTNEAGEHDHDIELGPHGHDVTGQTEALGQGRAISVVEKHVLQMCWHRVA